jgi:hypothetical protein
MMDAREKLESRVAGHSGHIKIEGVDLNLNNADDARLALADDKPADADRIAAAESAGQWPRQ